MLHHGTCSDLLDSAGLGRQGVIPAQVYQRPWAEIPTIKRSGVPRSLEVSTPGAAGRDSAGLGRQGVVPRRILPRPGATQLEEGSS